MWFVFLDESGYAKNWRTSIDEQPYFVLSAVCLPSPSLSSLYDNIRRQIGDLGVLDPGQLLGRGFEIKGRDIARGAGRWSSYRDERNRVREIMLSAPAEHGGCGIVVAIDKAAHGERYGDSADDPYLLAMRFTFERLQRLLQENDDHAICILDQNKPLDDVLHEHVGQLVREGSTITYGSAYYQAFVTYTFEIDRILEFTLGNSLNSLGLQVADFFASMAYAYYRSGQPEECEWWECLCRSLRSADGEVLGIGLKLFP